MSDAWIAFRDFVERTEDLPISMLVRNACARGMDDETAAPLRRALPRRRVEGRGARLPADDPADARDGRAREAGQRVLDALARRRAADARAVGRLATRSSRSRRAQRFAEAVGGPEPIVIENASHFLQEDAGEEIGGHIARWLDA